MAGPAETWSEVRAALRLPDEGGFDAAVRLAREARQRIGSLVARDDFVGQP